MIIALITALQPVLHCAPGSNEVYTECAHNTERCVQYAAKLDADKVRRWVMAQHAAAGRRQGVSKYNMRLAPPDVSDALSGYSHNAVTPICEPRASCANLMYEDGVLLLACHGLISLCI